MVCRLFINASFLTLALLPGHAQYHITAEQLLQEIISTHECGVIHQAPGNWHQFQANPLRAALQGWDITPHLPHITNETTLITWLSVYLYTRPTQGHTNFFTWYAQNIQTPREEDAEIMRWLGWFIPPVADIMLQHKTNKDVLNAYRYHQYRLMRNYALAHQIAVTTGLQEKPVFQHTLKVNVPYPPGILVPIKDRGGQLLCKYDPKENKWHYLPFQATNLPVRTKLNTVTSTGYTRDHAEKGAFHYLFQTTKTSLVCRLVFSFKPAYVRGTLQPPHGFQEELVETP